MEVNNTDVFQTLCHANFNDVNIYLPTDNAQLHECNNASISTHIALTILLRTEFYSILAIAMSF